MDAVDETAVQEFVADLKRATFRMRTPNGDPNKTYKLSRKTILNIVGVVKLVLGKKVWMTWELDLGKPEDPQQRYFTEEQLKQIIEGAEGQYRVLFALLAGTGMRIGEAAGLHIDDLDLDNCVIHVRRAVWNGRELSPKTRNAVREIDIDSGLADILRQHIGVKNAGRVFEARNGSPISRKQHSQTCTASAAEEIGNPEGGASCLSAFEGDHAAEAGHAGGFAKAVDWAFLSANNGQVFTHA